MVPIGASHISLPLQQIESREQEKKRTNEQYAWVNSNTRRELCNTAFPVCMCRLTLVWILAKILQRHQECQPILIGLLSLVLDSLMPTGLSAVPCRLLSPSFLANCQLLSPFVSLSGWRSLPTSGHAEISSPKPFVWFCAKTDKGIVCLADHLHSVTYPSSYPCHLFTINYNTYIKQNKCRIQT